MSTLPELPGSLRGAVLRSLGPGDWPAQAANT
jgi:hypothetical protein